MKLLSEDLREQPQMWMMVSEVELLYAESIQSLVQTLIPESLLRLNKEQLIIGPVLQVHTVKCLGICGTEIQIPSTISSKITSCVVICRGQNRNVE